MNARSLLKFYYFDLQTVIHRYEKFHALAKTASIISNGSFFILKYPQFSTHIVSSTVHVFFSDPILYFTTLFQLTSKLANITTKCLHYYGRSTQKHKPF